MMPWHFATELAAEVERDPEILHDMCFLKKARSTIEFSVPLKVILEAEQATHFETLDACLVRFPREVKNHKDILKYFHSERTANIHRDKKFVLHFPNTDTIKSWHGESYQIVSNLVQGLTPENARVVRKGFRYTATTDKGDCGALMACIDPSSGREKIMGIHTGGNPVDAHGFSTAICREDIQETLDLFGDSVVSIADSEHVNLDYNGDIQMLDGRFVVLGTTHKVVRASETTAIGPSRLIGEWQPPVTTPGRLRPFTNDEGILIDPFKVGLAKYCKPHVMISTELMALIGDHILSDVTRNSRVDVHKRLLTFDEAVAGIEGEPDYGSIPRGTSAGFPHNVADDKTKGKTKWFGEDGIFEMNNEACLQLKKDVAQIIANSAWLERQPFFYCDYLKDERRTHEKAKAGNTRIFSACPLEYTIVVRMYFGAFTLWFAKNRMYNGSAIGVNPYSHDWQTIAELLQQHGPKVAAGDYKAFDGSEQPEIHWAILDLINKWYDDGEQNARIRSMLWLELVNSRHIRGNLVYEWISSLPSGHPLTTLVNIFYGFFAFYYCWFRAHDGDEASLFKFSKNVYIIELGDDGIFNFSDACSEVFNQVTVSKFMAEIGLTYTDENKVEGQMVKWRTLEECTFLK
nr:non-structural polyprotein [Flumine dicistrovirus 24]